MRAQSSCTLWAKRQPNDRLQPHIRLICVSHAIQLFTFWWCIYDRDVYAHTRTAMFNKIDSCSPLLMLRALICNLARAGIVHQHGLYFYKYIYIYIYIHTHTYIPNKHTHTQTKIDQTYNLTPQPKPQNPKPWGTRSPSGLSPWPA